MTQKTVILPSCSQVGPPTVDRAVDEAQAGPTKIISSNYRHNTSQVPPGNPFVQVGTTEMEENMPCEAQGSTGQ